VDIKFQNRLSYKQARGAVLIALALGALFSAFQIFSDLFKEREEISGTVLQVLSALKEPATQAVYGLDNVLADKVAEGLFEYRPIYKATIVDDFGNQLSSLERPQLEGRLDWLAELFFGEDREFVLPLTHRTAADPIGKVLVKVDTYLIASSFFDRAFLIIIGGFLRNALLALILTFVFYMMVTKPLLQIIDSFLGVSTTNPSKTLLPLPRSHKHDEFSLLVETANGVLKSLDESLLQRRKLSQAVEQSPAAVVITDRNMSVEYVNPKYEETSGYSYDEIVGTKVQFIDPVLASEEQSQELWETITSGNEWHGELYSRRKNGEQFWEYASISPIKSEAGVITHFLAVKEDISIRKAYEERLLRQANYDELSGLPNRVLLHDRLANAINLAQWHDRKVAVMFIGLDRLKSINETLGYNTGDSLLKEAADRLQNSVFQGDTVARFGGDEFVVLLPGAKSIRAAERVGDRILNAFRCPFRFSDHEFVTTVSIGISVFPDDGDNPHVLLSNAQTAMNRAKDHGRDCYRFFTQAMNHLALERLQMENELRGALERSEMRLHYQPIINLENGVANEIEALIRWERPGHGLVQPDKFIPLAEDTGLVVPIGEWVIDEACNQIKKLRNNGYPAMKVAVNISSQQLISETFVDTLSAILERSNVPAEALELEVTERVLMNETPETIATLERISRLGVHLSIDDFGTGYSSLSYLRRFPFDILKIDRSFVKDVTFDDEAAGLVDAIIAMARSMDMKVVAEGVETHDQLAFLKDRGCIVGQGYLFSKPKTFEELQVFLNEPVQLRA